MSEYEILGPSGTSQTHEFLVSGCRYQWVHDHDSGHCWAAFLAFRGVPSVDEYYDWLDARDFR